MPDIFKRSNFNPILAPDPAHPWEARKLYNPGAIYHAGSYHLFYRAVGTGPDWASAIGYAVSNDGEHFERQALPLLYGETPYEARGLEDPRVSKIDDTFYMTYAAYDGKTPRLCIATSDDLRHWQKHGPVLSDWNFSRAGGVYTEWNDGGEVEIRTPEMIGEWSKSGAIFPERIGGRFWMLFGEHRIWFAHSDDGIHWQGEETPFLGPRSGDYFDNTMVEMGPPPIMIDEGWLVLYHGIDHGHIYRLGCLILDREDPRRIIRRSAEAIFEPQAEHEKGGLIDVLPGGLKHLLTLDRQALGDYLASAQAKKNAPQVLFCCGAIRENERLRIYYGAGDSLICSAITDLDKF